ncbi:MAG: AMP-binding protein [Candidatus Rokubacteria bacterium]|nr:AMP-binding protein [Candidatus Rokubacteria bacterium]
MLSPRAAGADRPTIEHEVLDIVGRLVAELGGVSTRGAVGLDDSLDRDLALGSLERVELLLRLERAFGVRLPDAVMAGAESPRDLARAILAAEPAVPERVPEPRAPLAPGARAPATAGTLTEVLGWHAEAHPARVHIFLREQDGSELPVSYRSLWERARAVATGLGERGVRPGDRVALMLRTEEAFFHAFFGVLFAGAVPVPIYPPFRADRIEEYARRQVGILRNAEPRWLISFRQAERVAGLLRSRVPSLEEVTTTERLALAAGEARPVGLAPGDPALIQYTSGSTGDPKGVLLSHANVLANIRAIGQAIAIRPDDVAVSWLPLYHDMGLIGAWLGALYFGIPIAILSPLAFLSRPERWLWALHAHRATVSPAPNFAFDLCVKKVRDEEIRGLDLGAWRLAFNGSEPVSAETIERFTRRFSPYGFRLEAMCPVYGLAESSVALTVPAMGRPPRVDVVAREPFQRSREALAAPAIERTPLRFVSCGRPLPEHDVRIVDAAGRPVGERVEGRIEFRGPSVTVGYFRNPGATQAVLRDGWMDSGDLGYWADGELFITGRRKDIIIKAGRNLHPQEVEEVAGDVPGIRKGCVAAFGVADPEIGTERLVVVAETRQTAPESRQRLRAALVDRIVAALGIPPDIVVISDPGSVPKTPSGKVRRSATREAYAAGTLARGRPSVMRQWARLLAEDVGARARGLVHQAPGLVYAAYVGGMLVLALPVLWGLLLLCPRGRAADRLVRVWCRGLLALGGCPIRLEGLENLLGTGPVVFASNHASYLDSVVLLAALPAEFSFVAKRELTLYPLIGTVIRKVGHLTVERADLSRSVAAAERATQALLSGTSLAIFPEGTFVRAPGLLPFRLGAFKAAVETGRPVIPVTIVGTREILPADTWLPRRGAITVSIGAPMKPEGSEWQAIVRLRDQVRAALARRSGERPVDGER